MGHSGVRITTVALVSGAPHETIELQRRHVPVPRVSTQQYLERHRLFQRIWNDAPNSFGVLNPNQQWVLHAYYQTNKNDSDAVLISRRKEISELRPSLSNQAGKAWSAFQRVLTKKVSPSDFEHHHKNGTIYMRSVVNPEIDVEKVALALLDVISRNSRSKAIQSAADRDGGERAA